MSEMRAPVRQGLPAETLAQATLEYALVTGVFLAMVAGMAAVWHAGEQGVLTDDVQEAASHVLDALGALDISLY